MLRCEITLPFLHNTMNESGSHNDLCIGTSQFWSVITSPAHFQSHNLIFLQVSCVPDENYLPFHDLMFVRKLLPVLAYKIHHSGSSGSTGYIYSMKPVSDSVLYNSCSLADNRNLVKLSVK
jgi:hypothetical protein